MLLAFFKISCPVCQLTAPYLERLAVRNERAVQVIGISQDDAGATRGFANRFGLTFPTLLDSSEDEYPASNAYGITFRSNSIRGRAGRHRQPIFCGVFEARFRRDRRARGRGRLLAPRITCPNGKRVEVPRTRPGPEPVESDLR